MEYKKKNTYYNHKNNNYYYNNPNKKLYNSINDQDYSKKENYNKDQEIEKLKNIIKTLKSKNSMLIEENKYLKLQIKQLKSEKNYSNNKTNFSQPKGKNSIYAEYIISDSDINKDIRIINHDEEIEQYDYDDNWPNYYTEGTNNKEEIEDSCLIYFGKKPIKFSETFNFYKPRKIFFHF